LLVEPGAPCHEPRLWVEVEQVVVAEGFLEERDMKYWVNPAILQ